MPKDMTKEEKELLERGYQFRGPATEGISVAPLAEKSKQQRFKDSLRMPEFKAPEYPKRAPAAVPTTWELAKEMAGDVAHAHSPEALSENIPLMGRAIKSGMGEVTDGAKQLIMQYLARKRQP